MHCFVLDVYTIPEPIRECGDSRQFSDWSLEASVRASAVTGTRIV